MSIDLNSIPKNIFSLEEYNPNEDFIAIGIQVDENGIGRHSGIFISFNSELVLYHFMPDGILVDEVNNINDFYLLKKIEIFDEYEDFIVNFKAICEIICEEANPEFGFIFDGSFYDEMGNYYTNSGIKDITTCVGFCIKMIKALLYNNDDYIEQSDWDESSLDDFKLRYADYYEYQLSKLYLEYPNQYDEIKRKYLKRILPSELTTSAYFTDLPVRKTHIDYAKSNVEQTILLKRVG